MLIRAFFCLFIASLLSSISYSQNSDFLQGKLFKASPVVKTDSVFTENDLSLASDFEGIYERAIKYLDENKIRDAKADLNYLILSAPDFGALYFYRGLCYNREQKHDSALYDFRKVLERRSYEFHAPARTMIGIKYVIDEELDLAEAEFEKALKLNPKFPLIYYAMGFIEFTKGHRNRAINYAGQALEKDSTFIDAYSLMAQVDIYFNRFPSAEKRIKRIVEVAPTDPAGYLMLRQLCMIRGKGDCDQYLTLGLNAIPEDPYLNSYAATNEFENKQFQKGWESLLLSVKGFEIDGQEYGLNTFTDKQIFFQQSLLFTETELATYTDREKDFFYESLPKFINNDYKAAKLGFNKIIESNDKLLSAHLFRGYTHESTGEAQSALDDYLLVLEAHPEMYVVQHKVGLLMQEIGKFYESMKYFDNFIELRPDLIIGYRLRGEARQLLTNYIGAIQDYESFMKKNGVNPNVVHRMAVCYEKLSIYDKALSNYEKVLELSPEWDKPYFDLATLHLNLKDTASAIVTLSQLLESIPKKANAYNFRGVLYSQQGEYHKALADFSKAIELFPYDKQYKLNKAKTYFDCKMYNEAIIDFTDLIRIFPDDKVAFYYRGLSKIKVGDKESGILDLKKALELGLEEARSELAKYEN